MYSLSFVLKGIRDVLRSCFAVASQFSATRSRRYAPPISPVDMTKGVSALLRSVSTPVDMTGWEKPSTLRH
jgi:hypothetical protein